MLNCIDNSGAAVVECVANLRMKRHAKIGTLSLCDNDHILHSPPLNQFHIDALSLPANNPSAGDRIIVVVQKQRSYADALNPSSGGASAASTNRVRRGDIRHAIVVRTKKKLQRKDGHVVRFDDNACVLINKNGEPVGTRLTGESSFFSHALRSARGGVVGWREGGE